MSCPFGRGGVTVAEQEYNQYAPQTNGRLFSNSMFGFNKEEVLEYLEELSEENYQRQAAADARIQDLTAQIRNLEASAQHNPTVSNEELDGMRRKLAAMNQDLDVSRTASQQAEGELHDSKEQLYTAQRENEWLREEYQKSDKQIAELRRQLDEASSGQWHGAEEQITELRRQVAEVEAERDAAEAERDAAEAERDAAEAERDAYLEGMDLPEDSPAGQAAGYIIQEANEEAERIRAAALADRDRIHRQILTSASGLAGSISTIREDVSGVEGDVSSVLESVQEALGELMTALSRTEQNLTTLGVAAERFPATSPPVSRQLVYFQPSAQLTAKPQPEPQQQAPAPQPRPAPERPRVAQSRRTRPAASASLTASATPPASYGGGGFRPVVPDNTSGKTRPFRPTYSNSPTASGAYFPQAAEVLAPEPDEKEERIRQLSETLVDTLMQMMN